PICRWRRVRHGCGNRYLYAAAAAARTCRRRAADNIQIRGTRQRTGARLKEPAETGNPRTRHRRVGLLGGSFNPAHGGHLHISTLALEPLDLDQVWWLVSPQNPLKPLEGMAPFPVRLSAARRVASANHRVFVTDLEDRPGRSRYTADTLTA